MNYLKWRIKQKMDKRTKELMFIASMFKKAIDEFNKVMGPETIQTIFRLIGETQGKTIEKRMREKFKIDSWNPEKLAELLIKDVFEPAIGEENADIHIQGNHIIVTIKACPFKKAGIKIEDKFYCTYTEGLVDTVSKIALKNTEFKTEKLQSEGNECCKFRINLI
jgi:predicted ArsR family transcriptional regulator